MTLLLMKTLDGTGYACCKVQLLHYFIMVDQVSSHYSLQYYLICTLLMMCFYHLICTLLMMHFYYLICISSGGIEIDFFKTMKILDWSVIGGLQNWSCVLLCKVCWESLREKALFTTNVPCWWAGIMVQIYCMPSKCCMSMIKFCDTSYLPLPNKFLKIYHFSQIQNLCFAYTDI